MTVPTVLLVMMPTLAVAAAMRARRSIASEGWMRLIGVPGDPTHASAFASIEAWMNGIPEARRTRLLCACAALVGALVGAVIAGPPAALAGLVIGGVAPVPFLRRRRTQRHQALEAQLADLVDACVLAVRGGHSVVQALEIGADEVLEPMASVAGRVVDEQRVGATFERALAGLVDTLDNEDARLFSLVMGIHHRSGGNVAAPLEEVADTIRHRMGVRREIRALTAQGRISGAILGALPIGFFLVIAITSHRQLAPVYHSPAGATMIVAGLLLEVLAYLWIRHLLRIEI